MTNLSAKHFLLPLLVAVTCQPAHASFARSTDASVQSSGESSEGQPATRTTAVTAAQRAKIARLRALAGSGHYRPTINCDTDVVNNAQWSGNVTILAGGMCPSYRHSR